MLSAAPCLPGQTQAVMGSPGQGCGYHPAPSMLLVSVETLGRRENHWVRADGEPGAEPGLRCQRAVQGSHSSDPWKQRPLPASHSSQPPSALRRQHQGHHQGHCHLQNTHSPAPSGCQAPGRRERWTGCPLPAPEAQVPGAAGGSSEASPGLVLPGSPLCMGPSPDLLF